MDRSLKRYDPASLLPAVTSGLIAGVLVVILQISFAALIFSDELSVHLSRGIGITLFGAVCIGVVAALTSSFPSVVACLQGSPAVILALMAGAIVRGMPAAATAEDTFVTVVTAIGLTSLLTGLFFFGLGWFKLGRLIRFVPYPVSGGFLAGTGLLLVMRAVGVMTGSPFNLLQLPHLVHGEMLVKWLPGVLFGVAMLIVERRYRHYLVMPTMLAAAVFVFYAFLLLTGTTVSEAGAQGLLLGPFPGESLWQPPNVATLHQANWSLIFAQIGQLGTILIISVISLLLNASGLELIARRDIDLNRELRSTGLANALSGLGGGPVGYLALSLSALGHKMSSHSRFTGIVAATLCAVTLFSGAALLSFLPRLIVGGLLLFLGLSFLIEWIYDAWFRMPRTDYLIVILILLVIAVRGFLDGVGLGLVIAVVLFVIKYSSVDVVKQALSGATSSSNVDRPVEHRRRLREKGEELFILRLQGYIFFGTAHNLYRRVRERANNHTLPKLHFVLLDFARVSGLDSSAEICFVKMMQLGRSRGVKLVFTRITAELQRQLERAVFTKEHSSVFHIFPDQDHGIEWCENAILKTENLLSEEEKRPLFTYLEKCFPKGVEPAQIMTYLEKREVEEGYYLMRQGEASDGLYFIESGQLIAEISTGGEPSGRDVSPDSDAGKTIRLRAMRPGTVVGEVSLYLGIPRTASVVTSKPSRLYFLSSDALRRMEVSEPELASAFHQFIARLLAERLSDNSRTIQALSD
jgi:SulP family sulfate permease